MTNRFLISVAALALIASSSLRAQTAAPDLSTATPVAGNWTYSATAIGSEASFVNASALPQLTIRCVAATRRITIAKPATGAAPFLNVWTSAQTRNLPASFNPATSVRVASSATATSDLYTNADGTPMERPQKESPVETPGEPPPQPKPAKMRARKRKG